MMIMKDQSEDDEVSDDGPPTIIDPSHRPLIDEVRRQLQHLFIDEFRTDFDILRWLQGHDFQVDAVVPKLKNHLRALRSFDFRRDPSEWNQLMKLYYPFGVLDSTGKDENFLFIDCTGRIDGEGVTRTIRMTDILLTTIMRLESSVMPRIRKREEETGRQSGLLVVMDMEGMHNNSVSMILNSYREFGLFLTQHYAELFQKIFMVNAASYMYYVWKLVKPFLPPRTQSKVEILGADWKKELLKHVDSDRLPRHWGGTMVDEHGDAMCRARGVIVPEKIPVELYWTPSTDDPARNELTNLSIAVGKFEFISIPVIASKVGGLLKWYFFTDADFSFGIFRATDEHEMDTEIMEMVFPYFNIIAPASKVPERGEIRCETPGVYRFRFGNEHAWIRRLKVSYKIEYVVGE